MFKQHKHGRNRRGHAGLSFAPIMTASRGERNADWLPFFVCIYRCKANKHRFIKMLLSENSLSLKLLASRQEFNFFYCYLESSKVFCPRWGKMCLIEKVRLICSINVYAKSLLIFKWYVFAVNPKQYNFPSLTIEKRNISPGAMEILFSRSVSIWLQSIQQICSH